METKTKHLCVAYSITPEDSDKIHQWVNGLPDKNQHKKVKVIFDGSGGIGMTITAKCGKHELDLTNVSNW